MQISSYHRYVEYLEQCGAGHIPHSGRSLLDHLVGTMIILDNCSADNDICLAGLFHSIYGTSKFGIKTLSFDKRNELQKLIGEHAEELVYVFAKARRPQCFTGLLMGEHMQSDIMAQLVILECANLLEQKIGVPFLQKVTHAVNQNIIEMPEKLSTLVRLASHSQPASYG